MPRSTLPIVAIAVVALSLFVWSTTSPGDSAASPSLPADSGEPASTPSAPVSMEEVPGGPEQQRTRTAAATSPDPTTAVSTTAGNPAGQQRSLNVPADVPAPPPTCRISGEVIGYGGYRVPGIRVTARLESWPNEDREIDHERDHRETRTDARGQFSLEVVDGGSYVLQHRFSGEPHDSGEGDSLVRVVAPVSGVDLLLARPTIRLRVLDLDGEPVQADRLQSHWAGPAPDPFSSDAPPDAWRLPPLDGGRTIVFDEPGPFVIIASSGTGPEERRVVERLDIHREHREVDLELRTEEKRTLEIHLRDEHGQPVEDWTVRAWGVGTGLSIDPAPEEETGEADGPTDGDGPALSLLLPVGHWKLRLNSKGDGYLRAFDHELRVALEDPMHRSITIEAPRLGGRIEGSLGPDTAPASILLRHESGARYQYSIPDGVGTATWCSQLHRSGAYTLTLRYPSDPDSDAPGRTREWPITITPGQTTPVDLR